MRLTAPGKIVVLLLALGFAIGGFRLWSRSRLGQDLAPGTPLSGSNLGAPTAIVGSAGAAPRSGTDANSGAGASVPENANAVTLLTSKSSKGWLLNQIEKFNAQQASAGGSLKVVPQFVETREAMHGILEGTIKPVLYAPSTTVWAQRLQSAWKEKHGSDILNMDDAASYRVYLKTPLVLVTTQDKARFLRPLLGRPGGWQKLHDLSTGKIKAPWGKWQWSHADPLTANSGTMTLGAILADYANASAQDDLAAVARSQKFRSYVRELEGGLKFDLPAQSGSSALFAAFVADPSRYDCITTYESNALAAAAKNPALAVIYPQPTVVSESVSAVLSTEWVSPQQKKVAQDFLQFLGSPDSIREGVTEGQRPIASSDTTQAARLSGLSAQGFNQSFTSVELPPYEALNAAAFNWKQDVGSKS